MTVKKHSTVSLTGCYSLTTDPEATWENLVRPDVLSFCIKGCDEVIDHGQGNYSASFTFGIGPIRKTVTANLTINEINPPDHYQLAATLETRKLGEARGVANVLLEGTDIGCNLTYKADVEVSGWFNSFSESVIRRAAHKAMDVFFDRFVTISSDSVG